MSRVPRNPVNWDEYRYGTSHRGSVGSDAARSVHFDDGDPGSGSSIISGSWAETHEDEERQNHAVDQHLRRRRSSVALRLNALAQAGGVNSIANFARSWQRAAAFHELTPQKASFILTSDDDDAQEEQGGQYPRTAATTTHLERHSLLRQHLEAPPADEAVVEDDASDLVDLITPGPLNPHEAKAHLLGSSPTPEAEGALQETEADKYRLGSELGSGRLGQAIFGTAPYLVAQLTGSYGTSYGTLHSTRRESSMAQAGQIWRQQQDGSIRQGGEREPLIVKEVEQDGKRVLAVTGQSTLPQTVFNATNVLIGVGLLSLPLGIRYAGIVCGMGFLFAAALTTAYTALLLAKCLDVDATLITFADLAFISYGPKARIITYILFLMELLAACVALVVLFADTLDLLVPAVGVTRWKILCGILLIPLNFVPLRFLSFTSVLGILSCFSLVLIVFIDGFVKPEAPGSLREPARVYLFPQNWLTLPVSFGILMSPFGGHSVFGNIYRDMRHPQKFGKGVAATFTFTYLLDAATAGAGILMFGEKVEDEITSNIIGVSGYPKALSVLMTIFIAVIPLTKLPLNAQPIVGTIELLTGLDAPLILESVPLPGPTIWTRGMLRATVRILVILVFVIIAIVFPAFDSIIAFMGSALCFTICVILPLLFHLKLFGGKISTVERILNYLLIIICSILATVGTIFAFLPKSLIVAD